MQESGALRALFTLVTCFLAGIVFGFAMEKGRVFEPQAIREQMIFRTWIMMKMFLAAMGTSTLVFGLLSIMKFGFVQRHYDAAVADFQGTVKSKNLLSVILGAMLLGVGMTLAGACPGMVLPQTGAFAYMSIVTLLGALLGSFVYLLLHDKVITKIFPADKFTVPPSIADMIGVRFVFLALAMGAVLTAGVVVLELLVPWKEEVAHLRYQTGYTSGRADSFVQEYAWPPFACGIIIGLLQLVIVFVADDTLGGSSSYATVVAQPARIGKIGVGNAGANFCYEFMVENGDFIKADCWKNTKNRRRRHFPVQETFPEMARRAVGLGNWWQVAYVIGGVVGGLVSALLSNSLSTVPGVPWYWALLGGCCLTFGARLAAGCTSGHGLSGAGLLMTASLIAVPCMFAGSIGLGVLMYYTGELDNLHCWSWVSIADNYRCSLYT